MASHAQVEEWWADYRCNTTDLVYLDINGRYPVKMQSLLEAATLALEAAIMGSGYRTPMGPTGSYHCRKIGGSDTWSLHAYGVAIDWDYGENPYLRGETISKGFVTDPRFELTEANVDAVEAIVNEQGEQIWRWLGWTIADTMHFQVNVPPERCQPYQEEDEMTYEQFTNEWIQYVADEDLMRMREAELFTTSWEYYATLRDLGVDRDADQRREIARFRVTVETGGWVK